MPNGIYDRPDTFEPVLGIPNKASRARSLSDILKDQSMQYENGPVGPGLEDNTAAYKAALESGEAARRREEAFATDNVLSNLQGRGLAKSGIAVKDIISQVLGPSAERANSLAAQFGLAQAGDASRVLSEQRAQAAALNQARLGGRLSSILNSDQANNNYDSQLLSGLQGFQNQRLAGSYGLIGQRDALAAENARAASDRRAGRQNAVTGAIGGAAGSGLAALLG